MVYITPNKVLGHVDRWVWWQRGDTPAPVTVEWDLSNRCVLGCQDCHFAHTHVKGPWAVKPRLLPMAYEGTGDLADTLLVRRVLRDMIDAGVKSVVWSGGGEPTTHPEWPAILTYAQSLGLEQGMYTCGGLLSAETARVLARCASWVVVSLDAADAETYAAEKGVPAARFEAACEGLRVLAGAQTNVVGASFLLHADNWRKAPQMLALARALGATYTTFRPAIRTNPAQPSVCDDDRSWITLAVGRLGAGSPLLEVLSREPDVEMDLNRFRAYRDWTGHGYESCYGIRFTTTITPDGRVWICPQRRGVTALGNLWQEPFTSIWSRHPGQWSDFRECRVMCRLHTTNQTLMPLAQRYEHGAFV